jgi:hypothetical protein
LGSIVFIVFVVGGTPVPQQTLTAIAAMMAVAIRVIRMFSPKGWVAPSILKNSFESKRLPCNHIKVSPGRTI